MGKGLCIFFYSVAHKVQQAQNQTSLCHGILAGGKSHPHPPRRPVRVTHYLLAIEDQSLPDHLPQVSTLRALFTRHLDINAVPKRSFFQLFKLSATDEREREKLEEVSSSEGAVT